MVLVMLLLDMESHRLITMILYSYDNIWIHGWINYFVFVFVLVWHIFFVFGFDLLFFAWFGIFEWKWNKMENV